MSSFAGLVRTSPAGLRAAAIAALALVLLQTDPLLAQEQAAPSQEPSEDVSPAAPATQVGARGSGRLGDVWVPRVDRPPQLQDFLAPHPFPEVRQQFAKVEGFTQRVPSDGQPATRATSVYLGYDDTNLYAVFIAADEQPGAIRARMSRREDIDSDDRVSLIIDTDGDQQRGYEFSANPFGIQRDALWTEGSGADTSFDTLWHSDGALTDNGYVVLMSIPFKSLRFPRRDVQTWGIVARRWTPRGAAEESTWPAVSSRQEGTLNQAGHITGLAGISPGRNIRLIPYGTFRSFRTLGETGIGPDFISDLADPDGGVDAKFVVKDSLVVDATFNPDFSQVESDQPQNTVNQRFEVFFPEKRPFFLENSNYFQTPINLLFTRRIADPQMGLRATGKLGGWAVGAIAIDDQAPGRRVSEGDPAAGRRARYGVVRVSRDIGSQSNIGALFVDRSFGDGFNRVGGVDGRIKLNDNWVASFQAVASDTQRLDGSRLDGAAYSAAVRRSGRSFDYNLSFQDIADGFRADAGFVPRVGIRRIQQSLNYEFWPEADTLISHGPGLWIEEILDRDGERLDRRINPWYVAHLAGQTNVGVFVFQQDVRLRPEDFAALPTDREYRTSDRGFWFNSRLLQSIELNLTFSFGGSINFVPAVGSAPEETDSTDGSVEFAYRPSESVRISGRWLSQSLSDPASTARVFRSDIYRSRLDWQLSRELSLRLIVQYESLGTNPELTALEDRQNLNADFLVTYLVNPWTSIFAGLNSNHQNLELLPGERFNTLRRTDGGLLNDSKQFFVKASYLFSY